MFCLETSAEFYSIVQLGNGVDTAKSALYLDLHFDIDSHGRLRTKLNDKKRLIQFSINMYQHSKSTCICSIYFSVNPIFLSLWFLS